MFYRIFLIFLTGLAVLIIAPMSGCYYDDMGYGGGYGYSDATYVPAPGYYSPRPSRNVYIEDRSYRSRYADPRLYRDAEEGREYRKRGRQSYTENYRGQREDYREGSQRGRRDRGKGEEETEEEK